MGSISMGPACSHLLRMVGGCGMQLRPGLKGWGGQEPIYTREGAFGALPKIEPPGLDIGGTCADAAAEGDMEVEDVIEIKVEGLGGPGARMHKRGHLWRALPKIELPGL